MRTRIITGVCLSAALSFFCNVAAAQDFSSVLASVEKNNTTIKALRQEADAKVAESRVGLSLSDPSVEFDYLWGTGTDNKTDLSVTQEFDFPTTYYWRKKIASGQASVAQMEYSQQRKAILLEAQTICIDIAYYNALAKELKRRCEDANAIMETWQKKYDLGEANILDLNKAKLNLITTRKEWEMNEVDRNASRDELARLNGGIPIEVTSDKIGLSLLPDNFETWFNDAAEQSPEIMAIKAEQAIAESSVKLATAQWLPKFTLGYVSEREAGAVQQGIGAGISIPLWENRGKVRAAKARASAAASRTEDAVSQFYNSMKNEYTRAQGLIRASSEYRNILGTIDSSASLVSALEQGHISLSDFVSENAIWYDAFVETLQAERDCAVLEAQMNSWKL